MNRSIVTVLIAVLGTVAASQARADTRVTVHDFYGPNAQRVRDDVVNLLERQSGVTIISKGQIDNAAARLGVDPFSPAGRIALGRELQLSAWMTGVVHKRPGQLRLTLAVFDGAQHELVGRTELSGRSATKLSAAIRGRLWRKSRYAILHAAGPNALSKPAAMSNAAKNTDRVSIVSSNAPDAQAPDASDNASPEADASSSNAEAPAPVPSADEPLVISLEETNRPQPTAANTSDVLSDDRDLQPPRGPRRGEALRGFIGLGSPYRSLSYRSPITSSLGDYRLVGAPMLDLNLAFHPARLLTDKWPAWLGLDLRAQIALSTPTVDRDNNQLESRYDAYHLGLRARLPVGRHYLSAFSGYAMNRLSVSAKNQLVAGATPSVDYRMIRSGAGAELLLSDSFLVGLDVAWLNFLSVGQIGRWFPRATAGGYELAMLATYNVTSSIFARACVSYQRTSFDFNARAGDRYAASGATDEYLAMSLGAGLSL